MTVHARTPWQVFPDEGQRGELARILESEVPITLHTREFDFYQVFLRLTGEEYN